MNNLEYLNEISKSNRPLKPQKSGQTGLIIKLLIGGVVAFALMAIIGVVLGSKSADRSITLAGQAYLRSTNITTVLNSYNKQVKSAGLRAIGSSLTATLSTTSSQLNNYLIKTEHPIAPEDPLVASESAIYQEFNTALSNARLNGILDRIYSAQVKYQISILLSILSEGMYRASDEELLNIFTSSYTNLNVIWEKLNDFSDRTM